MALFFNIDFQEILRYVPYVEKFTLLYSVSIKTRHVWQSNYYYKFMSSFCHIIRLVRYSTRIHICRADVESHPTPLPIQMCESWHRQLFVAVCSSDRLPCDVTIFSHLHADQFFL